MPAELVAVPAGWGERDRLAERAGLVPFGQPGHDLPCLAAARPAADDYGLRHNTKLLECGCLCRSKCNGAVIQAPAAGWMSMPDAWWIE